MHAPSRVLSWQFMCGRNAACIISMVRRLAAPHSKAPQCRMQQRQQKLPQHACSRWAVPCSNRSAFSGVSPAWQHGHCLYCTCVIHVQLLNGSAAFHTFPFFLPRCWHCSQSTFAATRALPSKGSREVHAGRVAVAQSWDQRCCRGRLCTVYSAASSRSAKACLAGKPSVAICTAAC